MATDDVLRSRLDAMINRWHPLAVLTTRMPWSDIEAALARTFELFGPTTEIVGAGVSVRGHRRLPIRLMTSLRYFKHAFNLSDEELVARRSENVSWQFFNGTAIAKTKALHRCKPLI